MGSYLTEDGPVSEEGHAALLPVLMTSTDEDLLSDDAKTARTRRSRSVEAPEGFETYFAGSRVGLQRVPGGHRGGHPEGREHRDPGRPDRAHRRPRCGRGRGYPILLAAFAIVGAMGLTALVGTVFSFSFFVQNMITMIGLAVGIDYSLFIVARYREERLHGRDKLEAIGASGATASRAVFFSGMTVVLALARHAHRPDDDLPSSRGRSDLRRPGGGRGVDDLLPAILALMGDKVNALRRAEEGRPGRGRHGLLGPDRRRIVMRRPVISLVAGRGFMILLALPYFSIHTGTSGVSTLPDDIEAKQAFDPAGGELRRAASPTGHRS